MSICTFAAVSNMNMCLRDSHALDLVLHQSDLAIGLVAGVTVHRSTRSSVSSFYDGRMFHFEGRLAIGEPAVLLGVYTQRRSLAERSQGAALHFCVLSSTPCMSALRSVRVLRACRSGY
jgi:hypothetical protein